MIIFTLFKSGEVRACDDQNLNLEGWGYCKIDALANLLKNIDHDGETTDAELVEAILGSYEESIN